MLKLNILKEHVLLLNKKLFKKINIIIFKNTNMAWIWEYGVRIKYVLSFSIQMIVGWLILKSY